MRELYTDNSFAQQLAARSGINRHAAREAAKRAKKALLKGRVSDDVVVRARLGLGSHLDQWTVADSLR